MAPSVVGLITMPASDLKNPDDRTADGTMVKYLYCPECSNYSGGGLCRVCDRANGPKPRLPVPREHDTPPAPAPVLLPIDEQTYRRNTISQWERTPIAAVVTVRRTVPAGTTGRITAKRNRAFTVEFDNGRKLVKVPYQQLGIVVERTEQSC